MTEEAKNNQNSEVDSSVSEIEKIKAERDEYLNGWKRAKADLINYQKEEDRRLGEMARFGLESILEDIVGILDSFNHGLAAIEKSQGKVDQGLYLIKNQVEELLRKRGVNKIEAKAGEEYNPMYHEAIQMVEPNEAMKSGQIAEVVEPGYMIHAKVLKPARVKVVT